MRSLFATSLLASSLASPAQATGAPRAWFGTYTAKGGRGIYTTTLDPATGLLSAPVLAAESPDPSFLALGRGGAFLYAVQETGSIRGTRTGAVRAFAVDPADGGLRFLNEVASGGADPCHLTVVSGGRGLLASNYSGGSLALLPVDRRGGLGEAVAVRQHRGKGVIAGRQEAPHVHSTLLLPGGIALAADLGLDRVFAYRVDGPGGRLEPALNPFTRLEPGSGPRHMALHPGGHLVFVVNELASTITTFSLEGRHGDLRERGTVTTLPAGFTGLNDCADLHVHPSGRFLYASNRGHDSIAVFAVDQATGALTPVEHVPTQGRTPRNFALAPGGRFLFAENQDAGTVVGFKVDPTTGRLTPTGQVVAVPSPVCMVFD
jgi:6-phosphogluconolactonase